MSKNIRTYYRLGQQNIKERKINYQIVK